MTDDKTIQKGTHVELFQPVVKDGEGKYVAVLSANSTDRDEDMVSEKCLRKMAKDDNYTAILIDHENKALNQVGEWVNKQVVKKGDIYALTAEPKFYLSNPKAKQITGMLDEGAKMGISIGAIVHDYTKMEDKKGDFIGYQYDTLELVEASFVAIPSNRHGRAVAVAKMFKNNTKVKTVEEEDKQYSQKDFDSKVAEVNSDFEKKLDEKNKEFEALKADSEKSIADLTEQIKAKEDELTKNTEALKKLEELKVYKAKHEEESKAEASKSAEDVDKKAEKAYKENKELPTYDFNE